MKKTLLLVILFPLLFSARGSDTLTIRQIYNFDVGDTFDYKVVSFDLIAHPQGNPFDTSYQRYVITGKIVSGNGDTMTYHRHRIYPSLAQDSISITNLDNPVLALDTPSSKCVLAYGISSNWDSSYNSVTLFDSMAKPDCNCNENELISFIQYERGLGITASHYNWLYPDDNTGQIDLVQSETDSLIYWSKGNRHGGHPYYTRTTGINTIIPSSIHLYPNPTSDLLHLSFPEASQYNARLVITDILGEEVYTASITDNETTHDISKLAAGIYTWRIIADNAILKTGKIIKQ